MNVDFFAEATNAIGITTDLCKVKVGEMPKGILVKKDEEKIIEKAIRRFAPLIFQERENLPGYINMLAIIREDEKENEKEHKLTVKEKLECLIKALKDNNIFGAEALQSTFLDCHQLFVGGKCEKSWIKIKKMDGVEKNKYVSALKK